MSKINSFFLTITHEMLIRKSRIEVLNKEIDYLVLLANVKGEYNREEIHKRILERTNLRKEIDFMRQMREQYGDIKIVPISACAQQN